jgi:predicted small lipoprotein YifL
MNRCKSVLRIIAAAGLTALTACGIGKPMAFPESESQLTPRPGAFTDGNGEWVIYRR